MSNPANRPRGWVNTPASTAADMRAFVKRHGVKAAMEACGLCRQAISSIAAEMTVQASTLEAAREGLRRVCDIHTRQTEQT